MKMPHATPTRRQFLQTLGVASLAGCAGLAAAAPPAAAPAPARPLKLGLDSFAVRACSWKAPQLVEYAAAQRLDSLFICDLDPFESLEPKALAGLKDTAAGHGLQIIPGTWSVCPTSKAFKANRGTAEELLALGIRTAQALGSPLLRVLLGTRDDRGTPGGIEARIRDTAAVCRAVRGRAFEAGVKLAFENHAGDLQAREMLSLLEQAGPDFVGVFFDTGNATWTLETPAASLEILGPHVLAGAMRDSMIWESEAGAKVQWTAVGEGLVDWPAWVARFQHFCPEGALHIETISGFAREFAYLKPEFWEAYPRAGAADFARFLALARRGRALEGHKSPDAAAEQAYQKGEVERSLRYCRETLGLGRR